jgi:hypothetical protein
VTTEKVLTITVMLTPVIFKHFVKQQILLDVSCSLILSLYISYIFYRLTQLYPNIEYLEFNESSFVQNKCKSVPIHAITACTRNRQPYSFLNSTLDGGEWSTSRSGRFILGKGPRWPLNRRLGGPQSRSGLSVKEKSATYIHTSVY